LEVLMDNIAEYALGLIVDDARIAEFTDALAQSKLARPFDQAAEDDGERWAANTRFPG